MSLYLKYRPQTIDQLDLESVRAALGDIVKANNVAHAYLFTGPRGAGKTSSARILARIVNCVANSKKLAEPCNKCDACLAILSGGTLDFIEIDAASNRGIDDIRELKEKIRLAPSELKYKVYIIDEVHMLTTEAFNALLKTLEEPPAHAIFVLCTTETHKVPETIKSRCVRVTFAKATPPEMKRSFARVVAGEGKSVDEDAIEYLARSVDGSFRDGVKILDRVLATRDKVTLSDMESAISGIGGFSVAALTNSLINRDVTESLKLVQEMFDQGVDLGYLTVSLMKSIRDILVNGGDKAMVGLVMALDEVARKLATSPAPELLLQMVIIDWCDASINGNNQAPSTNNQTNTKPENKNKSSETKTRTATTQAAVPKQDLGNHQELWKQLLLSLNGDSITLGALLSKARPAHLAGDVLTIHVDYEFHREQIMSDRVLRKLEDVLERAVGSRVRVICEVGRASEQQTAASLPAPAGNQGSDTDGTIEQALAIFT